jgi:hypothetical protein
MKFQKGQSGNPSQVDAAQEWYDNLLFTEQQEVDRLVNNYILHVRENSGRQPASKKMGIELVYAVMRKGLM